MGINKEKQEVEVLQKVEDELRRHERRERIQRFVIGGLGVLAAAAFLAGKCCKGKGCRK
ncbi:MAG: hypothetical protein MRZ32_02635 [Bacteroidales bacterium]|nr:hypothetical protein [Bacteroidales bacterium]MDY2916763.1 hypothetical protein [Muribaculaceae bacterium]